MPTVDASDFAAPGSPAGSEAAEVSPGEVADEVSGDFGSDFAMPAEIKMPESRLHNAIDKVGGLFSRKRDTDSIDEGWGDDADDFGWKGGGYLDASESAFAAAKARASQIRDSVVSMTESDLLDKEVWFVALGASSAGNQGMRHFLELHGADMRGALIVNLECVGAGELGYLEREGRSKAHASDRRLQNLVRSTSRDIDGRAMEGRAMNWRDSDATPAFEQGLRALTIMGFDGDAPELGHWGDEGASAVSEDNLELATRLMLKVIEDA